MTLTVLNADISNFFSSIYTATAAGDIVWLTEGTIAVNQTHNGSGFLGAFANWTAIIDGALLVDGSAIGSSAGSSHIEIGVTGSVRATATEGNGVLNLFGGNTQMINRGDIFGGTSFVVTSGGGDNQFFNYGTTYGGGGGYILGLFGATGDSLVNSGTITAGVTTTLFNARFNHGVQIEGNDTTVLNSGTITATLAGAAGVNVGAGGGSAGQGSVITNTATGVIESTHGIGVKGDLMTAGGGFTLINRGVIEGAQGSFLGAAGDDFLRNAGTMIGDVSMGEGSNQLTNRGLIDGLVSFGSGADRFSGTKGGVTGSISGGAGADTLLGGNDGENLYGGSGLDRIVGGSATDLIIGGSNADTLTGGGGADTFQFNSSADIGKTGPRETITDFNHLSDQIDLQGFMSGGHFIGSAGFSAAGQVRYTAATGLLEGEVNGDGTTDWAMLLSSKPTLTAGDFIF